MIVTTECRSKKVSWLRTIRGRHNMRERQMFLTWYEDYENKFGGSSGNIRSRTNKCTIFNMQRISLCLFARQKKRKIALFRKFFSWKDASSYTKKAPFSKAAKKRPPFFRCFTLEFFSKPPFSFFFLLFQRFTLGISDVQPFSLSLSAGIFWIQLFRPGQIGSVERERIFREIHSSCKNLIPQTKVRWASETERENSHKHEKPQRQ